MILKVISANSADPDQTQGPHCLPVCKNRFEKFARIFSRQLKQATFSDADFLGILRVNGFALNHAESLQIYLCVKHQAKNNFPIDIERRVVLITHVTHL